MRSHLPDPLPTWSADLADCRELLRGGSRTFSVASHVLPQRVSDPAIALYAFCRLADDAVDLRGGKIAALERLRDRLERAYAGRPYPAPADRAFAEVISRFGVPCALPEALL
jgi:15-cis-phytoene synthase